MSNRSDQARAAVLLAKRSGSDGEEGWVCHVVTRPSELVVPVKGVGGGLEGERGRGVSVTGMEVAGRPVVVSRTWQVIGGRVGEAIVDVGVVGVGELGCGAWS